MIIFLVGILEMVIVTAWTKAVTDTKVLLSGIVTLVHILIWYYVLQSLVSDIKNWHIAVEYAGGCAVGTMLCTYYYKITEQKAAKPKTDQPV